MNGRPHMILLLALALPLVDSQPLRAEGPATLLFFAIGTALFMFYQSHPERLDPTITTDQVFPFFIAPEITSLFDTFIKVVGLFMGMLGGLFLLGVLTRRASAGGACTGAMSGAAVMCWLFICTSVNGYLYITIGMSTCIIVGYIVSYLSPNTSDLSGLTIFTLDPNPTPSRPTST